MTLVPVCQLCASWRHAQLTLSLVLEESIDLGGGSILSAFTQYSNVCDSPVVGTNLETLVVHVEDQVLTLYV